MRSGSASRCTRSLGSGVRMTARQWYKMASARLPWMATAAHIGLPGFPEGPRRAYRPGSQPRPAQKPQAYQRPSP